MKTMTRAIQTEMVTVDLQISDLQNFKFTIHFLLGVELSGL